MSSSDEIRKELGNDRLIALLREVDREMAQSEEVHIADDPELLERWDNQMLTFEEHESFLKHISACDECSQFLDDMIRAGVFGQRLTREEQPTASLEEMSIGSEEPPKVSLQKAVVESRTRKWFAIATVACVLLIAAVGYQLSRNSSDDIRLADAKYGQLLHYLSDSDFAAIAFVQGGKSSDTSPIPQDAERDQQILRLLELERESPNNVVVQLNLGQLLLEAGRLEDAESRFRKVNQQRPDDAIALLGLGLVQFRSGQWEKADSSFSAIPDESPLAVSARVNRVLCLLALGRKPEAREVWKKVPPEQQDIRISRVLAVED